MPSDLASEPTTEYLDELIDFIDRGWQKTRDIDTELRALSFDEHAVWVTDTSDKKRKVRVPPQRMKAGSGGRIRKRLQSFFPQPPTIGLEWAGEGKRGPKVRDELELALGEAVDSLNVPTGDRPWYRGRDDMIDLGRCAHLIVPGDQYYWDMPLRQDGQTLDQWHDQFVEWKHAGPLSITWIALPAESTFPASFGTIDDEVVSSQKLTWYDLRAIFSPKEFGEIDVTDKKRLRDEVTLLIYANRRYLVYAIHKDSTPGGTFRRSHGHILRSIEHKMGVCPIRILPAVSGIREDGKFWKGVLYDVRDIIKSTDERLSDWATASRWNAKPLLALRRQQFPVEGAGSRAEADELALGDLVPLLTGDGQTKDEDIFAVQMGQYAQHTQALVQFGLSLTDRITGTPEVLDGIGLSGAETAWQTNIVIQVAKQVHAPLSQGIVAAIIDNAEMILRATKAWGEDIVVARKEGKNIVLPSENAYWHPIIKGEYEIRLPTNRIADMQISMQLAEASEQRKFPLTKFWIMENLMNIEQPYEMYEEWLRERFLFNDPVMEWHTQQLLKDAELVVDQDRGYTLEEFLKIAEQERLEERAPQLVRAVGQRMRTAQGAARAGAPLSTRAGGPQPMEEALVVQ